MVVGHVESVERQDSCLFAAGRRSSFAVHAVDLRAAWCLWSWLLVWGMGWTFVQRVVERVEGLAFSR